MKVGVGWTTGVEWNEQKTSVREVRTAIRVRTILE
jgi:hypothetical protein